MDKKKKHDMGIEIHCIIAGVRCLAEALGGENPSHDQLASYNTCCVLL